MKFKEMEVKFTVLNDKAFNEGNFHTNRKDWTFTVKREISGCFNYGDRSCHTICIDTPNEKLAPHYYDTRYDGISSEKSKWIEFWQKFIEHEWTVELDKDNYKYEEETFELEV